MNLFRRQPMTTLPQLPLFSQLSDEMSRFFERDFPTLEGRWNVHGGQWQPDVDIETRDKEYVVHADIPGVDTKNIKVSMEEGVLSIEGKRETKAEENRENYRCIERNYGAFYRSFRLPDVGSVEKVKAHNHNGVLEIIIPKSKSSTQKTIPIISD